MPIEHSVRLPTKNPCVLVGWKIIIRELMFCPFSTVVRGGFTLPTSLDVTAILSITLISFFLHVAQYIIFFSSWILVWCRFCHKCLYFVWSTDVTSLCRYFGTFVDFVVLSCISNCLKNSRIFLNLKNSRFLFVKKGSHFHREEEEWSRCNKGERAAPFSRVSLLPLLPPAATRYG